VKPVSLFIFDLDGTLVNTLGDITASVNFTLAHFGKKPLDMNTVRRYVGNGINVLIERSLGEAMDLVDEAVSIYKEHHHRNLTVYSTLYPSVRETLEYFNGTPMAIITNKSTEFCSPLLEHLDIARYFKPVIGADSGLALKPAPDGVWKIMQEHNAPAERAVIVGDSLTDIHTGKAAGITTCAVTYGYRPEEELKAAAPDFLIPSFPELKKLFYPEKPVRK
jgi:phosphoglycolate phosphatase